MTTAKLSGDKLKRLNLYTLLSAYIQHYEIIIDIMDDYTTDTELKKQIKRQLDGVITIIRKSIDRLDT